MTIKTLSPEAKTHKPINYDFAAVGIVVPEVAILHPSVAGHTDEMLVNESPEDGMSFSLTHDGVLTDMHKFANRYGILGVSKDDAMAGKNAMVGFAIEQMLTSGRDFYTAFLDVVPRLKGAFSIIAKHEDHLFVALDRHGIGNMFIGELPSGGHVASSQEQSVHELNGQRLCELEPGTIARIGTQAVHSTRWAFR